MKLKKLVKDCLKWVEYKRVNSEDSGYPLIFQCKGGAPGLFSYVVQTLGFVRYAHNNNRIPVIDLQSFVNTYLAKEYVGILNAWEYFFKQPSGISLNDVDLSKTEVFDTLDPSRQGLLKMPWWDWECLDENSITNKMWRAYAHKYIRFSDNALKEIERTYNELFSKKDKELGIQCRGTDYTRHKPKDHPVQPSPEMVIEKADQLLREKGFNKIFLATEDGIVYRKFKDHFGDMLVSSDKNYSDYDGNAWINAILPREEQAKLEHGMAYLISMALLTRCQGFVAGRTSGSVGVMLLSKGFEYSYFFDLGFYS